MQNQCKINVISTMWFNIMWFINIMWFHILIEDTNQAKSIKCNWFSNNNKTQGNQVATVHGSGTNTGISSYSWILLYCFWMPLLHCKRKSLFSAFPFIHLSEYSKICSTADMSRFLMYKHKENRFFFLLFLFLCKASLPKDFKLCHIIFCACLYLKP